MNRRRLQRIVAIVLAVSAFARANAADEPPCHAVGNQAITDILRPIRQKYHVPAIAAAIVTTQGVDRCGAVGVRKSGADAPVTLDDQWHLGSDTKAMTATLLGKLVEQGLLKWDTPVADLFPDLAGSFDPEMKKVTLLHLLSHHAGLPANPDPLSLAWLRFADQTTPSQQRRIALKSAFSEKPAHPPGSKFLYSNLGYTIAGAVVEKLTGMSWEEAVQADIFKPLDMKSAGFGGIGTPGKLDQPWGHTADGRPVAQTGPAIVSLPIFAPAGQVHCTIQDWAKFVADQLRGARGEPALLKAETYQVLHTPPFGDDYALGWGITKRPWGGGTVWIHEGDNSMNHATVGVAPNRGFAVLICANQGGDTAGEATDKAAAALIELHNAKNK